MKSSLKAAPPHVNWVLPIFLSHSLFFSQHLLQSVYRYLCVFDIGLSHLSKLHEGREHVSVHLCISNIYPI